MKDTPQALVLHMQGEVTTIAKLWKIQRPDGIIQGFTEHDVKITYLTVDYEPIGGVSTSAVVEANDLSVNNLSADGSWDDVITSNSITDADLRNGIYDYSKLSVMRVNWNDLTMGHELVFCGIFGKVEIKDSSYRVEIRDIVSLLHQPIGQITSRKCRHRMGDRGCKVNLTPAVWQASTAYEAAEDAYSTGSEIIPTTNLAYGILLVCEVSGTSGSTPPTWPAIGLTVVDGTVTWRAYMARTIQGTVSAVHTPSISGFGNDNAVVLSSNWNNEPTNWYAGGVLTWTSGANDGLSMEIQSNTDGHTRIDLIMPMPYDIQENDRFITSVGCNYQRDLNTIGDGLGDCNVKHNNVINFGGEPDVPGIDRLIDGAGS